MDGLDVIAVLDFQHLPVVGFKSQGYILCKGYIRTAFDADFIIVIDADQFAQAQVSGKGSRFTLVLPVTESDTRPEESTECQQPILSGS